MSRKYKIRDQDKLHFVTFTVVEWIDVFIRNEYKEIFLDSVKYCQKNKGLEVYAWVIMTNHIHMILRATPDHMLENIIRDLKSHTSRTIRQLLEKPDFLGESRRKWMLQLMKGAGKKNNNNHDFQFWQQHNHPIELSSNYLIDQKLDFILNNPVKDGFVASPEMWQYSSATDYYSEANGMLQIDITS